MPRSCLSPDSRRAARNRHAGRLHPAIAHPGGAARPAFDLPGSCASRPGLQHGWRNTSEAPRDRVIAGPVVFLERLDRHRLADRWVELPVTRVFEVRGGRITAWRDYFDAAAILGQWPAG